MDKNLEKKLSQINWKPLNGLLVPASLQKISALDVSMSVYLTSAELGLEKYTVLKLKEDLSVVSVEDALIVISRILTILENEGAHDKKVQKGLVAEMFGSPLKEKILESLSKKDSYVMFFELQLLVLAKYAILFCKKETASDFKSREVYTNFLNALVGVNDLILKDSDNWGKTELQKDSLRSMYLNSKQNFLHTLGRVTMLFQDIPREITDHHQYIDLEKIFKKATGLSIADYMMGGFSLLTLLSQQKGGKLDPAYWVINKKKFFIKSKISDKEVETLLKEFSIDLNALEEIIKDQKENFEYNFNGIKQHPLINIGNDLFYPLGLRFLKEKISVGIYWILFDYINKSKIKDLPLSRYTNFMGAVFEIYVFRILSFMYPDSGILTKRLYSEIKIQIKSQEIKTVDSIIVNPSSLIFLESKVSQLQVFKTGIEGDLSTFRDDIKKIVVEGFKQIQNTKIAFEQGLLKTELGDIQSIIKQYYPVVVTYGSFPVFPLLWEIVEEEVSKIPNFDKSLFDNLQIINVDELEALQKLLEKTGLSFEQLLKNKNSDIVYKQLPLNNYIYFEYSKLGNTRNDFLGKKYEEFSQNTALKFFGKKMKIKKE